MHRRPGHHRHRPVRLGGPHPPPALRRRPGKRRGHPAAGGAHRGAPVPKREPKAGGGPAFLRPGDAHQPRLPGHHRAGGQGPLRGGGVRRGHHPPPGGGGGLPLPGNLHHLPGPRPVLRLPGRRPEKAGHPLLCVPARQGGRRARHPVCAGGLPGGAGGLSDRGFAGAAENRRLRLYRRGDCQPGELRLFVEALRPGMAPGIHPPPPGLWPGAHPGGPGGACPPQRPAPAAHGPLRALRRPHPGGHRRGDFPGGVPAAAGL
ncbi:unknown [Firmicutes bacterium CAG:94]|nr:unknown [Firmicutes bacterium CAG:94]